MAEVIKEWRKIYEEMKEYVVGNIPDVDQQEELIDLLSTGQKNIIVLEECEKRLHREPDNQITCSEYSNALRNALHTLFEVELLYKKLRPLILHKPGIVINNSLVRLFVENLHDFKEYIESDGLDVFWENRNEGKFVNNPEIKAQTLYAAFFIGKMGKGRVLREVKCGIGRIDAIQIYQAYMYGIEFKMLGGYYGEQYAKDGIEQLFAYLRGKDLKSGYLLIFDGRQPKRKIDLFDAKSLEEGLINEGRVIFPIIIDINPIPPHEIGKLRRGLIK